jgi:micrococcal nuclease
VQFLIAWLVLTAVHSAFPHSALPDLKRSDPVMVRYVVDGDTIDVATFGRVRLLGIDAPEIAHAAVDTSAPFGQEARDRLTTLVLRRWVRLEQEGPALDVYNRHLAYVVGEDGTFVNAVLVREGLARVSARLPLARLDELKRAEAEAQAFRRGIWGQTPGIPMTGYTRKPLPPKPAKAQKAKPARTKRSKKSKGSKTSWQRFPSSMRLSARSASTTSFITASTTGRSGSSSFSSRPAR